MSIDVLFVVCTTVSAHCQEITQAPSQNQKLKRQKLRSKNLYFFFATKTGKQKKHKSQEARLTSKSSQTYPSKLKTEKQCPDSKCIKGKHVGRGWACSGSGWKHGTYEGRPVNRLSYYPHERFFRIPQAANHNKRPNSIRNEADSVESSVLSFSEDASHVATCRDFIFLPTSSAMSKELQRSCSKDHIGMSQHVHIPNKTHVERPCRSGYSMLVASRTTGPFISALELDGWRWVPNL